MTKIYPEYKTLQDLVSWSETIIVGELEKNAVPSDGYDENARGYQFKVLEVLINKSQKIKIQNEIKVYPGDHETWQAIVGQMKGNKKKGLPPMDGVPSLKANAYKSSANIRTTDKLILFLSPMKKDGKTFELVTIDAYESLDKKEEILNILDSLEKTKSKDK